MQIMECPICLQEIKNKITTHCNHRYCDICIISHLLIKNTCPICRSVCEYNQLMDQIKPHREQILIQKICDATHTHEDRHMNSDIPIHCSFVMTFFIIETIIIICMIFYIAQKVNYMYNQENK